MKLITQNTTLAKELDRLCVEYDEFYWLTYNLDILCPFPERIKLLVTQCINGVDEKAKIQLDEAHQSFVESILNYYRTYCDTCFFWVRGMYQKGENASDEKSKFHSKVYLFRNSRNRLWEAIIGSFNYAQGGFEIIQSSVLISHLDDSDGSMYVQMISLISTTWKENVYLSGTNSTSNNTERYQKWFDHFNTVERNRETLPVDSNYVTQRTVSTFHQELIPLWKIKDEVIPNTDKTLDFIIEAKSKEMRIEDSYKHTDGGILDKLIGDFVLSVDYIFTKESYVLKKHNTNKNEWEKHRKNWSEIVKYSTDILDGRSFELDILRHELVYFESIKNTIDEYFQNSDKDNPAIIEVFRSSHVIGSYEHNMEKIHPDRIQFQKELLNTLTDVMFL